MKSLNKKRKLAILLTATLMMSFLTPMGSFDIAHAAEEYGDTLTKLHKNTMSVGKKKTFTSTIKEYTKIYNKKLKLVKGGIFKKPVKVRVKSQINVGKIVETGDNYKITFKYTAKWLDNPKIQTNYVSGYTDDDPVTTASIMEFRYPDYVAACFDYKSGKNLRKKNPMNVKVKHGKGKTKLYSKQTYKTHWAADDNATWDNFIRHIKSYSNSITVTYPKSCGDVVVAIGPYMGTWNKYLDDHDYWDYNHWDDDESGMHYAGELRYFGDTLSYKTGKLSYIRLPGEAPDPVPSETTSPEPSESSTPTAIPSQLPSATPIIPDTIPTPSVAPTDDEGMQQVKTAIAKANSSYETLKSNDTANNWKDYDGDVSTVLELIKPYDGTVNELAIKDGLDPSNLNEFTLDTIRSRLFGDAYMTFVTNKTQRLSLLEAVTTQEMPTVLASRQFNSKQEVRNYLKGVGTTNLSTHAVKSAVTVGSAEDNNVKIKVTFYLGVEKEFIFTMKKTTDMENDGIVIV